MEVSIVIDLDNEEILFIFNFYFFKLFCICIMYYIIIR